MGGMRYGRSVRWMNERWRECEVDGIKYGRSVRWMELGMEGV